MAQYKDNNRAERDYPGAAVNEADKKKVNKKLVDERTCTLNNNPRTGEIDSNPAKPPRDN